MIDDSEVMNLFNALDDEVRNKIMFKALKAGADYLKQNTTKELTAKLGIGATSGHKLGRPMTQGIKLRADKSFNDVTVNIMGDYRLRFFERGTKERITRKTKSKRGSIKPLNFFRSARGNESQINEVIIRTIDEGFSKIK